MTEQNQTLEVSYQFFSTNSHSSFRFSELLATYIGEDDKAWVDPLDPDFMNLLKLPRTIRFEYSGKPLTTVSQNVYGNSSLWFLILCCTPYYHPHQIPRGEIISVPSVDVLLAYFKNTAENKGDQGKIIII